MKNNSSTGTYKMQNEPIFSLKSKQDYNFKTQISPLSLPHLIIEKEKIVLGSLSKT
jgi:hypothetical protein